MQDLGFRVSENSTSTPGRSRLYRSLIRGLTSLYNHENFGKPWFYNRSSRILSRNHWIAQGTCPKGKDSGSKKL